jgi:AbrB family looped-hinge helix DNA binding protein
MKEIVSTITSKGQVTIPVEIRKHLGLATGTKIAFVVDDEGNVSVRSPTYPTIASLAGAAGKLPEPMEWKEMRRIAIEDYIAEKYGDPHGERS